MEDALRRIEEGLARVLELLDEEGSILEDDSKQRHAPTMGGHDKLLCWSSSHEVSANKHAHEGKPKEPDNSTRTRTVRVVNSPYGHFY